MLDKSLFITDYYLESAKKFPLKKEKQWFSWFGKKAKPFAWLEKYPTLDSGMATDKENNLAKLQENCRLLNLKLPETFIHFINSPELHEKIGAVAGEFVRLQDKPLYNPHTGGYMICFITDSQYCWHNFLHLYPGSEEYAIVWVDDEYSDILETTPEERANDGYTEEYEQKIPEILKQIYLLDDDFEQFIYNKYHEYIEFFRDARDSLIRFACSYMDEHERNKMLSNLEKRSAQLLGIHERLRDEKTIEKYKPHNLRIYAVKDWSQFNPNESD